jgi:hypothetical protein
MKNLILETKILTELNRMKEIMGLSLITEGVGDELLKLLGFDSKTIDNLIKSGFDISDLSKLSDEFTNLGIRDVADFKRAVSYLDDAGRFTNEALTQFVKQNPTLMDEIANIVTKQSADYAKNIVTNANISTLLGPTRSTTINDLLSAEAFQGAEDNIIARIDIQLRSIDTLIDDIQSGKVSGIRRVPDELSEVRDSLSGKKADLENLKSKRRAISDSIKASKLTADDIASKTSKTSSEIAGSTKPNIKISETQIEEIRKVLDGEVNISNYTKNLTDEETNFVDNANNKLTQEQKNEFLETIPNKFCGAFAVSALKESKINKILLKENIFDDCMYSLKRASKKGTSAAGGMFQTTLVVIITMVGIAGIIYLFPRLFLEKEWGILPDYSKKPGSDEDSSGEGGGGALGPDQY